MQQQEIRAGETRAAGEQRRLQRGASSYRKEKHFLRLTPPKEMYLNKMYSFESDTDSVHALWPLSN